MKPSVRRAGGHVFLVVAVAASLVASVTPVLAITPTNDRIGNATAVSSLPYSDTLDSSDATGSASDPDCFGRIRTVWYKWTASETTQVAVSTFGSSYDTNLAVFEVPAEGLPSQLGPNELIACIDNSRGTLQSRISFGAVAQQTYYIRVGSQNQNDAGSLVFRMEEVSPPANDTISGAVTVDSLPAEMSADTSEASTEPTDPRCAAHRTVWYKLIFPAEDLELGTLVRVTASGDYDAVASVHAGTPGSLRQIECGRQFSFDIAPSQTLYLMVGSSGVDGGNLRVTLENIAPPPPPLEASFRVKRTGFASALSRKAAVQGNVDCSRRGELNIDLTLQQRREGGRVRDTGFERITCEGLTYWAVTADGPFRSGEALLALSIQGEGVNRSIERIIRLASCTLIGSPGSDRVAGSAKDDVLCGLTGNDTLIGKAGDDKLLGGAGNDRLDAGAGNDVLIGATGADVLFGGEGTDTCDAGQEAQDEEVNCE